MAYVGNVAAFLVKCLDFKQQIHLFNYADKPDLTTKELVQEICKSLGKPQPGKIQIPYSVGLMGGYAFDTFCENDRTKITY